MSSFRMLLTAAMLALCASGAEAQNALEPLPAGWGNATRGVFPFKRLCSKCHSLSETYDPGNIVGSCFVDGVRLFHYLKHQMPRDAKGSLTDVEVYSLIAYLLSKKKMLGSNDIINSQTLPLVAFPNSGVIPAGCPVEAGGFGSDKFAPGTKDAPEFVPAPPPLRAAAPAPSPVAAPPKPKPAPKPPAKQATQRSIER